MENNTESPCRKNIRLCGYNYSTPANYFVTIVIQNRKCLLGDVCNGKMILNDAGMMVLDTTREIGRRFPSTAIPHYVVMPNHVHLIIQNNGGHNIIDVMRWFKSITTNKYIHGVKEKGWIAFEDKLWQRNIYDHIIRNQRSYDYIANYIFLNPQRWVYDRLNGDCVDEFDDIGAEIKMLE